METEYNVKQVIVIRSDLKMSRGKLSTQVAHASVTAFYETLQKNRELAIKWLEEGQPKIVVKVDSIEELLSIKEEAEKNGLISVVIKDAGLTELEQGTITCLGIGPDYREKIDRVTGRLKLL